MRLWEPSLRSQCGHLRAGCPSLPKDQHKRGQFDLVSLSGNLPHTRLWGWLYMSICRCWARGMGHARENLVGEHVVLALLVYMISYGHRGLSQVSGERHKQSWKISEEATRKASLRMGAGIEPHGDDYKKQKWGGGGKSLGEGLGLTEMGGGDWEVGRKRRLGLDCTWSWLVLALPVFVCDLRLVKSPLWVSVSPSVKWENWPRISGFQLFQTHHILFITNNL